MHTGLDDLRDWTNNVQDNVPIYVARRDIEVYFLSNYLWYLNFSFWILTDS